MITLYGIANCDTIKKAKCWLEAADLEYEFHDYKKQGCSSELAKRFLQQFELDKLVNKRGTTWRKLPEPQKNNLDTESAVALMASQPSIIKRPIVKVGNQWLIGFDAKHWQSMLT